MRRIESTIGVCPGEFNLEVEETDSREEEGGGTMLQYITRIDHLEQPSIISANRYFRGTLGALGKPGQHLKKASSAASLLND